MSNGRVHLSIFIFAVILNVGSTASGVNDSDLRQLVLAEYPKALVTLEDQYSTIYGRGILRILAKTTSLTRPAASYGVVFRFRPGSAVFSRMASDPELVFAGVDSSDRVSGLFERTPETLELYNSSYSASLLREQSKGEYTIKNLDSNLDLSQRTVSRIGGKLVKCSTATNSLDIRKLFTLPGFRLDRVASQPRLEGPLSLRIDYSIERKDFPEQRATLLTSGWLVVDPQHQWILHEYGSVSQYRSGLQLTNVGQLKYTSNDPLRFKPLSSSNYQYEGRHDSDPALDDPPLKPNQGEELQFLDVQFEARPEREFTLSGFGLPEFTQASTPRQRSSSMPWWILGVSAIALGVAVIAPAVRGAAAGGRAGLRLGHPHLGAWIAQARSTGSTSRVHAHRDIGRQIPGPLWSQANGSRNDPCPIRFAVLSDGLANTLVVAEKSSARIRSRPGRSTPNTGRPSGTILSPGGWWTNLPRAGIWQAPATRSGGEAIGGESW